MSGHPVHGCARHQALTQRERARLSGILARLASPYDGERAAAGLLASAFVAKHGLAWADLTATLQPADEAPTAPKEPSPGQERRRNGSKTWRGFCGRRPVPPGKVLVGQRYKQGNRVMRRGLLGWAVREAGLL